jgi:hypothetical protein
MSVLISDWATTSGCGASIAASAGRSFSLAGTAALAFVAADLPSEKAGLFAICHLAFGEFGLQRNSLAPYGNY